MTLHTAILTAMLAREFGREMTASLSPADLKQANEHNAQAGLGSPVCHTHDFCDANMVMDAAFRRVLGRGPAYGDDAVDGIDDELWNAAWSIAKARRFWGDPEEAWFQEWRQTMEACADLGAEFQDEILSGEPGLTYDGGYIECPVEHRKGGAYYLLIERSDWASDDLEALERILFFEWVLPEGYAEPLPIPLRPYCKVCGWRKGGPDSWDGKACKCKLTAEPIARVVRRRK